METLGISWIDYGDVRGGFAYSIGKSLLELNDSDIKVTHLFRWCSSNIPLNRYSSLTEFLYNSDADWLLCVDSDIIFTPENVKHLWAVKSKERQVLSGIYFLTQPGAPTAGHIFPAIFRTPEDKKDGSGEYYHPLPVNQIVEISRAGFGFLLLSREVVKTVIEANPNTNVFLERSIGTEIVGEDFVFFEHLEKLGIKAYADTSNFVTHEKSLMVNGNTYSAYWKLIEPSIYGVRND